MWNLKKRTIVTRIITLRTIAPVITTTEMIAPAFPVLNCPMRVPKQMRKTKTLMTVRRMV
jgi:hypothetical protein